MPRVICHTSRKRAQGKVETVPLSNETRFWSCDFLLFTKLQGCNQSSNRTKLQVFVTKLQVSFVFQTYNKFETSLVSKVICRSSFKYTRTYFFIRCKMQQTRINVHVEKFRKKSANKKEILFQDILFLSRNHLNHATKLLHNVREEAPCINPTK